MSRGQRAKNKQRDPAPFDVMMKNKQNKGHKKSNNKVVKKNDNVGGKPVVKSTQMKVVGKKLDGGKKVVKKRDVVKSESEEELELEEMDEEFEMGSDDEMNLEELNGEEVEDDEDLDEMDEEKLMEMLKGMASDEGEFEEDDEDEGQFNEDEEEEEEAFDSNDEDIPEPAKKMQMLDSDDEEEEMDEDDEEFDSDASELDEEDFEDEPDAGFLQDDEDLQTNIAESSTHVLPSGQEISKDGLITEDLAVIQHRIQEVVRILSNFTELREEGRFVIISLFP